jgi:hypothetical protein
MSSRFGLAVLVLPWTVGCYSSGIHYHGVVADPLLDASAIEVGSAGVPGPELGVISASCETPTHSLEGGISYGDLACSEGLLQRSMREWAAQVGGTHLVDTHCATHGRRVSCDSRVIRR